MSASTEKKIRQANREAGTDKKIIAAQEEAAKKAKSKRRWVIGTVAVIVFIVAVLLLDSPLLYTGTTALDVSGTKYSPAEVSYSYANQYYTFTNQYGSYASIFGLDTSAGLTGLRSQECNMTDGGTWRDYFLDSAVAELTQVQALGDYAAANGITLNEDELSEIEQGIANLDQYASIYGYASADKYLSANYGMGVNSKMARELTRNSTLANKAYNEKRDSFEYTDAQLDEKYDSYEGSQDIYSYAYCTISVTDDVTAEQAKAKAEAIVAAYNDSAEDGGEDVYARFEAAAQASDTASFRRAVAASSIVDALSEWVTGERTEGEAAVLENTTSEGYYAAVFLGRSDNRYNVAQVRHILVKAVADENGEYTDEAKAEAKAKAEDILAQWKAGDATEESFAALATELSEDSGSSGDGGLYDSVTKGQMVDEFDKFCFEGHEKGDPAIVYGESSSYAGYHVMYYVGEGELYSRIIARNDLLTEDMNTWFEELIAPYEAKRSFFIKLVG